MNKVLLVMGASSDMGLELIRTKHQEYDAIFAHYRTMSDELRDIQDMFGDKIRCLRADLSDEEQVLQMLDEIKSTNLTPTHIVHFPAPLCNNLKFHKIDWQIFQNELNISLKSLILVLQCFLPQMSKQRYGRVVVILSFVVDGVAPAYCTNYVVTKYAMWGLVKALSTEYAGKGIAINGVSPAWVDTKYIRNQPELLIEKNIAASPLNRLLLLDDILPTINYLLSEGAGNITGQNILITGGRA